MKISHRDYRAAIDAAYSTNICNPTIFWDPNKGFYAASGLVKNDNLSLGLAHYTDSGRAHTGTRGEYAPIARAIRAWHKIQPVERAYTAWDHSYDCEHDLPRQETNCGPNCKPRTVPARKISLAEFIRNEDYV